MSFTTNWSEVTSQLSIFLSDEGTGDEIEYSQQQRIDAWNWSQRALVSHTPRQRECSPVVNAGGRSAELPEDFYEISRVYCEDDSQWLRPMRTPQPGERRSSDRETSYYWFWGRTIVFERTLENKEINLYYWAYWPEVEYRITDDTLEVVASEIIVPQWTVLALCHLTAATCLAPGAIQAARIRNWNIIVDSGNPVQNSRAAQAREHWQWWQQLLRSYPPLDRSGTHVR